METLISADQKQLAALLEYKKETFRLKNIINNLPGSIYWKDKQGIYLGHNYSSAEKMRAVGLEYQSIIGKTDYELFPREIADQYRLHDLKVIESGIESVIEESVTLPTGEVLTQLSYKRPLRNERNEIVGIVGNTVDITYLKKVESELREAKEKAEKANQAKHEIIKHMEHDIRTPFNGIWILAGLLEAQETDEEKKGSLQCIAKSAKELLDYCNNILDFIKTDTHLIPVLEKKFNLRELMEQVVSIEVVASKSKNLKLLMDYSNDLPEIILGDPHRIQRILLNLTSNAIKFTDKGYVKLTAKLIEKVDNKNLIICLAVEDTGSGIPAEKQAFIYERFSNFIPQQEYRRQKGIGTGLGLPLVKILIKELEGELDLKSEEGKGSKFICTLRVGVPLTNNPDYLNE